MGLIAEAEQVWMVMKADLTELTKSGGAGSRRQAGRQTDSTQADEQQLSLRTAS